jgi:hypothetical protein
LYAGQGGYKGRNLVERVSEHYSRGTNLSGDIFRKHLKNKYGLTPGQPLQDWVLKHCKVSWVNEGIETRAKALQFEHFAIAVLKPALQFDGETL